MTPPLGRERGEPRTPLKLEVFERVAGQLDVKVKEALSLLFTLALF